MSKRYYAVYVDDKKSMLVGDISEDIEKAKEIRATCNGVIFSYELEGDAEINIQKEEV